jgi:hypothetical protein
MQIQLDVVEVANLSDDNIYEYSQEHNRLLKGIKLYSKAYFLNSSVFIRFIISIIKIFESNKNISTTASGESPDKVLKVVEDFFLKIHIKVAKYEGDPTHHIQFLSELVQCITYNAAAVLSSLMAFGSAEKILLSAVDTLPSSFPVTDDANELEQRRCLLLTDIHLIQQCQLSRQNDSQILMKMWEKVMEGELDGRRGESSIPFNDVTSLCAGQLS